MSIYNHNKFLANNNIQNSNKISGTIFGVSSSKEWASSPRNKKQIKTSISKILTNNKYVEHKPSVSFAQPVKPSSININVNRLQSISFFDPVSITDLMSPFIKPDIYNTASASCECVNEGECAECVYPSGSPAYPCSVITSLNIEEVNYTMVDSSGINWMITTPYPSELTTPDNLIEFTSIINNANYSGVVNMDINVELCNGQEDNYSFTASNTGIIIGSFTASNSQIKTFTTTTTADTCYLTISYSGVCYDGSCVITMADEVIGNCSGVCIQPEPVGCFDDSSIDENGFLLNAPSGDFRGYCADACGEVILSPSGVGGSQVYFTMLINDFQLSEASAWVNDIKDWMENNGYSKFIYYDDPCSCGAQGCGGEEFTAYGQRPVGVRACCDGVLLYEDPEAISTYDSEFYASGITPIVIGPNYIGPTYLPRCVQHWPDY